MPDRLNHDGAAHAVREHLESLFPKTCGNCQRTFETLRDYILNTTPVGPPMSFDADARKWDTQSPIGSIVFANCACGSTLGLSNDGMPMPKFLAVMDWLKSEVQERRVKPSVILAELRERVRREVLSEEPS